MAEQPGSGMQRTSVAALIGVAGFSAAATLILMRRFYGAVASISILVPSSLWVLALTCGYLVVVVKKRREDGRIFAELSLRAAVAAEDGSDVIRASVVGPVENAGQLGATLAAELLDLGAGELVNS